MVSVRRNTSRRPQHASTPERPVFLAAVRFTDGRRERIRIRNAYDLEDARREVFGQLADVAAVVVTRRPD